MTTESSIIDLRINELNGSMYQDFQYKGHNVYALINLKHWGNGEWSRHLQLGISGTAFRVLIDVIAPDEVEEGGPSCELFNPELLKNEYYQEQMRRAFDMLIAEQEEHERNTPPYVPPPYVPPTPEERRELFRGSLERAMVAFNRILADGGSVVDQLQLRAFIHHAEQELAQGVKA